MLAPSTTTPTETHAPVAWEHTPADSEWAVVPAASRRLRSHTCSFEASYCHRELGRRFAALRRMVEELRHLTRATGVAATVQGRIKTQESALLKIRTRRIAPDRVMDWIGARVIVDTVSDCYHVLERIHRTFEKIDGCQRDYILAPKLNGYQSLHTTVRDANALPVEIQLRTHAMHEFSERGPASHWAYKGAPGSNRSLLAASTLR